MPSKTLADLFRDQYAFPNKARMSLADLAFSGSGGGGAGPIWRYLPDYGVIGDNSKDDRVAIQTAIDDVYNQGGGRVLGVRNHTYFVSAAPGTKTFQGAGGLTTGAYCIELRPNVILDLQEATLRSSANAVIVSNSGSSGTIQDDKIGLVNATIDGSGTARTSLPMVWLTSLTNLMLKNVKVQNATYIAAIVTDVDNGFFDKLSAKTITGQAWQFGIPTAGFEIRDSFFGDMFCETISNFGTTAQPGNPFYGVLIRCVINSIRGRTIAAGVKLDRLTEDVSIGKVLLENGTTVNSGLKFQGDATGKPKRITVDSVITRNMQGEGLRFEEFSEDISVGHYIGLNNGAAGTLPDVWIGGTRCSVGDLRSSLAGQSGMTIRATAVDYHIGHALIRNPGQITGAASSTSSGIGVQGGSGVIDDLECLDDQGTVTMNRGLDVNGAAARIRVGHYRHAGSALPVTAASNNVIVENPELSTDPLIGEFTPANAATSTAVANGNIWKSGTGPALEPSVSVQPMNAAARALAVHPSFASGTVTFNHLAAAGTERFRFRIEALVRSTNQSIA